MQKLVAADGWPPGLLCPSDLIAYSAYRLATETGRTISADCRVVGIDDNLFNGWIAPWLSSISIPYRNSDPLLLSN